MKRTFLLAVLVLMVVPSITEAYYYSSVRYRTRWSPYVHGLISGDVYYSPYAFKYGHSGLVSDDFRYNPYAFSYGHSGLIYNSWYRYPDYNRSMVAVYYEISRCAQISFCQFPGLEEPVSRVRAAKAIPKRAAKLNKLNNARQIICNYLTTKGIKYRQVDGCSLSNVDFLLTDMNIILRYQNPTEVQRFERLPEDNHKRILYEKYKQRSAERFKEFPVYIIKAANEEETLTGLTLCFGVN